LFNIYINSLANLKVNGNLVLFVDDTALVIEAKNYSDLYQRAIDDLIKIRNWLVKNRLSLNITKIQYVYFCNEPNSNIKCKNDNECCYSRL